MKNLRQLLVRMGRQHPTVCRQMEFSLPGSRLTRHEISFLRDVRRIREQISASRA